MIKTATQKIIGTLLNSFRNFFVKESKLFYPYEIIISHKSFFEKINVDKIQQ